MSERNRPVDPFPTAAASPRRPWVAPRVTPVEITVATRKDPFVFEDGTSAAAS